MGAVFTFVFGLWVLAAVPYSVYCWAKKTDRSDEPVVRRSKALGFSLLWPYDVYRALAGRREQGARQGALDQSRNDILG